MMLTFGLVVILIMLLLDILLSLQMAGKHWRVEGSSAVAGVAIAGLVYVWPIIAIHNASHAHYRTLGLITFLVIVCVGTLASVGRVGRYRYLTNGYATFNMFVDLVAGAIAVSLYATI